MNLYNVLCILVIILITQCLVVFAAARSVFVHPRDEEGRLVGGHTAKPHEHPYMVSLQLRIFWVRAHFCGGSLLNSNWILTAGHCVTESWLVQWLNVDAVAGAHNVDHFNADVQIQKIVQRLEHTNYLGGIGPNDIAMLKTEHPFVFTKEVQPIRLPPENIDLSQGSLVVAGWGALNTTRFIPQLPSLLQSLSVTYVPYNQCSEQIRNFLTKYDNENPLDRDSNVCTGPLDGGKAACVGDSGGPLVLTRKSKLRPGDDVIPTDDDDYWTNDVNLGKAKANDEKVEEYLVGVVSWGVSPCGEIGAPTVYTDVSKFLDFIKSYINT